MSEFSWIILLVIEHFSSSLQIIPRWRHTEPRKPLGITTRDIGIGFHFHAIIGLEMKQLIPALLEHEHDHKRHTNLFTRPLIHITQTLSDSNSRMQ